MTDTAQETQVAVEEAAPAIEATEAVEQQVVSTEDVTLETGTPGDEAQQPLSKREVRQQMNEERRAQQQEARQKEAEGVTDVVDADAANAAPDVATGEEVEDEGVNAAGRKFDKKSGQFLTEGEGEAAATGEAPAEAEADAQVQVAEVEPIVVPIPTDHFVREMGQASLTASDPAQEQVIRALINGTYERVRAVEARDQLIAARDQTILELRQEKVRREASAAAMGKYEGTDAYKAHAATYDTLKAAELEGTVAAGTASAFWMSPAVQQDVKPLEDAEYDQRWSEVEAQAEQEAGEIFVGDALRSAQSSLPPEVTELAAFKEVFDAAISTFDSELSKGQYQGLTTTDQVHEKFNELLRVQLVRNTGVRRVLDAKLEESGRADKARELAATQSRDKAAANKAVEAAKREAADKRRLNPTHPLGMVADAHRGSGEPGPTGSPSGEAPNLDKMQPHQLKRHLKKESRNAARARYQQR